MHILGYTKWEEGLVFDNYYQRCPAADFTKLYYSARMELDLNPEIKLKLEEVGEIDDKNDGLRRIGQINQYLTKWRELQHRL